MVKSRCDAETTAADSASPPVFSRGSGVMISLTVKVVVTDDMWPIVSQAGFISIVIPDFALGQPSLENAWIGRLQIGGKWQRLASAREALILA